MKTLTLPPVQIVADNLAEGWERSVLACWEHGTSIPTQYDQADDPNSRDITLMLTVENPWADPRIHLAMPGGLDDLMVYVGEAAFGVHDHWVDPEAGKWQYTYHERLEAYSVPGNPYSEKYNQLDYVVRALAEATHTRRAQATVWKPWEDAGIDDPACLQRLWFRVFDDELVMNMHMRSNDAFKAAYMNMYAFTEIQALVAARLSNELGRVIRPGQYTHVADSFHIYGSYFGEFEKFLETIEARSFAGRSWTREQAESHIQLARQAIANKLKFELDDLAKTKLQDRAMAADKRDKLIKWWSEDHPWLTTEILEEVE